MALAKRLQSDSSESVVDPTADVDVDIPDDVVVDKVFVGRLEPSAQHSQEVLDEDDAWLGLAATELWEYDVVDGREQDFIAALRNSEVVMEFSEIDETNIDQDDLSSTTLQDSGGKAPDEIDFNASVQQGGSGIRSIDDGPGGQPTGDASASGMGPSKPYLANDEVEGIGNDQSGGIDDLSVLSAEDPSLGLTNYADKGPDDWAADTGPTRNPGTGVRSSGSD